MVQPTIKHKTMNTVERLLQPRYKVIADAPRLKYNIGRILTPEKEGSNYYDCLDAPSSDVIHYPEKYPAVFRKLEWWEDRKPEEMPEYLKLVNDEFLSNNSYPEFIRVDYWIAGGVNVASFCGLSLHPGHFIPATEAEYLAYNQQQSSKK